MIPFLLFVAGVAMFFAKSFESGLQMITLAVCVEIYLTMRLEQRRNRQPDPRPGQ